MFDTLVRVGLEIGLVVAEADDHTYVVVRFHDRFAKVGLADLVPLLLPSPCGYGMQSFKLEFFDVLEGYNDEAVTLVLLQVLRYNIHTPSLDLARYVLRAVASLEEIGAISKEDKWRR